MSELFGEVGMTARFGQPPRQLASHPPVVRRIVHLRWRKRLRPVAVACEVCLAPSTAHRVLVGCGLNRLSTLDRRTGPVQLQMGESVAKPVLGWAWALRRRM